MRLREWEGNSEAEVCCGRGASGNGEQQAGASDGGIGWSGNGENCIKGLNNVYMNGTFKRPVNRIILNLFFIFF